MQNHPADLGHAFPRVEVNYMLLFISNKVLPYYRCRISMSKVKIADLSIGELLKGHSSSGQFGRNPGS